MDKEIVGIVGHNHYDETGKYIGGTSSFLTGDGDRITEEQYHIALDFLKRMNQNVVFEKDSVDTL